MCGIVYLQRKDGNRAHKQLLKRYSKQKSRGQDGFGYVALDSERGVMEYKRFQTESGVRKALEASESKHVLFHHRYPTSTANVPESAHPIFVKHAELKNSYYVVHNGVISNPDTLKSKHEALGYKYSTEVETCYKTSKGVLYYGEVQFNDSEALAIELARTIEGLQPESEAKGSIACMVLQTNKAGTKVKALYYGTNGGNPLTVTDSDTGLLISSEGGTPIKSNVMYRIDFKTNATSEVKVPLQPYGVYHTSAGYGYGNNYGNYGHYGSVAKPYESIQDDLEEEDYTPRYDSTDTWGEMDMEDLEHAFLETSADLEIAKQAGESEEAEELEIELDAIKEQIIAMSLKGQKELF